jgi:hypothetical protein
MPRRSRKRYAPKPVDLTDEIALDALARDLEGLLAEWSQLSAEDRRKRATERLRAIDRESEGGPLADLRPDSNDVDIALAEHVMRHYDRHLGPVVVQPIPLVLLPTDDRQNDALPAPVNDGVAGSPGDRDAIARRFLTRYYRSLVEDPFRVPDPITTAGHLIEAANGELDDQLRRVFDTAKRRTLKTLSLAICRSLTNGNPERVIVRAVMDEVNSRAEEIAGRDEYDPLSVPVLRQLVQLVAELLEETHSGGIAEYSVRRLQEIFTPRELVVLEGCARHWTEPDLWPWKEVLRHRHLHLVMNEDMLSKTASKVRSKLKEYPDLGDSVLDVAPGSFD